MEQGRVSKFFFHLNFELFFSFFISKSPSHMYVDAVNTIGQNKTNIVCEANGRDKMKEIISFCL